MGEAAAWSADAWIRHCHSAPDFIQIGSLSTEL